MRSSDISVLLYLVGSAFQDVMIGGQLLNLFKLLFVLQNWNERKSHQDRENKIFRSRRKEFSGMSNSKMGKPNNFLPIVFTRRINSFYSMLI